MALPIIIKADGSREVFDPTKLEHSLQHAGATSTARARVLARVMEQLRPEMHTGDIYRLAFDFLQEEDAAPVAARYSIKRAVFDLGPSGFPFEQFLAEVLRAHGWRAQPEVTLVGRCAPHEVDVLAEKDGKRIGIEAKFHNDQGGKTDIQVALYVKARYDDLKMAPTASARVDEGWLVTNTRFTQNAIRYARCSNLTLLGWDYPRTRGLLSMITEGRVHPLTCLTSLTEGEKKRLLEQNIVLCKSVTMPQVLRDVGVKPDNVSKVVGEAKLLCGI